MKITTVHATFSSTLNLGNYKSAKLEAGYEATLEPGEDPATATQALFDLAQEEVKARALPIVQRNKLALEEVFLNLPEKLQQEVLQFIQEKR